MIEDRPAKKIIVLVGMIAAGKSTYCRNAVNTGQLVVNDDALVNMLHSNEYFLYDKELKILYKSIENQIIGAVLAMGRQVLVDRGLNCSVKGRQRWLAIAESFDVLCEAIVFPHDGVEAHARRRANSDSRGHSYDYWLKVANAHNKDYKTPTLEEGFGKVHHISFEEIQQGRVVA